MRSDWLTTPFLAGAFLTLGMLAFAACGDDGGELLCEPGANIFCRCRGGSAGTKQCDGEGTGFGACETARGSCDEVPTSASGATTGSNTTTSTGTGSSSTGMPPDPGELLAACDQDSDCTSGNCPTGFCTKGCTNYQDCDPGDCVAPPHGVTIGSDPGICVPYCSAQTHCEDFGADSKCSYTTMSFPSLGVAVCGDWDSVVLPPDGQECAADTSCSLGLALTERICNASMECATGCNMNSDCPSDMCNMGTSTCGGGPGAGDDCPGIAVAISKTQTIMLSGDTSMLPGGGNQNGTEACVVGANSDETVYQVNVGSGGNLIVSVDSLSAAYDPVLYVRSGACGSGMQIRCEDASAANAGEITELIVFDGETVYVIVDGFEGSEGAYNVTFDIE